MCGQSLDLVRLSLHQSLLQALINAKQEVVLRELALIVLPQVFEEVLTCVLNELLSFCLLRLGQAFA